MNINPQSIQNRIDRAKETIEEAILMKSNGYNLATLNRLYYAVYYAASAALLKTGIIAKTHSGVRTQFMEAFIKTDLLPQSVSVLYTDIFKSRQSGDYDDFFTISDSKIDELIADTRQTLTLILDFIPTIDQ